MEIVKVDFDTLVSDLTHTGAHKIVGMVNIPIGSSDEREEYSYITPSAYSRMVTGDKDAQRYSTDRFRYSPFIPMGIDNKYPMFLEELPKRSHTHKSAIRAMCNMAYGLGYKFTSAENPEFAVNITAWMKSIGFKSQFIKPCLKSLAKHGGAFVDIIFTDVMGSMGEDGSTQPNTEAVKIKLVSFIERRLGKPNTDLQSSKFGDITHHWNNKLMWNTKRRRNPSNWKGIPVFTSMEDRSEGDKVINETGKEFYQNEELNIGFYSYMVGEEADAGAFYPEAPYESTSAINAILLEEAISYLDLAGVQNGLSAGYIVTAALRDTSKNDKDEYEKRKNAIITKIQDELTGEDMAGNVVVMFQDPRDKAEAIKITPIPHINNADMHKTLEERKRVTILTAWGIVDERIIGVPNITSKGQSSQSDALKTAEDISYKLVAEPALVQKLEQSLVEDVLIPIYLYLNNLTEEDIPEDFTHGLVRNPLFYTNPPDSILLSCFSINEIREMFGYSEATEATIEELSSRGLVQSQNPQEV